MSLIIRAYCRTMSVDPVVQCNGHHLPIAWRFYPSISPSPSVSNGISITPVSACPASNSTT